MSKELVIVANKQGSSRVSVTTTSRNIEYKTILWEDLYNSGLLNGLAALNTTLGQAIEHQIRVDKIFAVNNVANLAKKLMAPGFNLEEYIETRTQEGRKPSEEFISLMKVFLEVYPKSKRLVKEIRSAYSKEYIDRFEQDVEAAKAAEAEKGITRSWEREFKVRMVESHRMAWDLLPAVVYVDQAAGEPAPF